MNIVTEQLLNAKTKNVGKADHALIVIDIVNGCCHQEYEFTKWGLTYKSIRKMVPKLKNFISYYKSESNGLVVYVKVTKWLKNKVASNIRKLYQRDPDTSFYTEHNASKSVKFYKVKPKKKDVIITKKTYDAFAGGKLHKILKNQGIKTLLVTGVFGDGCVHATINGAFSLGYELCILKDLVGYMDNKQDLKDVYEQKSWRFLYGEVVNSSKVKNRIKRDIFYKKS
jgi:nicotinamidase-related amidase